MIAKAYNSQNYRYGFNGKEKDEDITEGDYDFEARIYDSRVARFLSIDPAYTQYPNIGTYTAFGDNPIYFVDPEGETLKPGLFGGSRRVEPILKPNNPWKKFLNWWRGFSHYNQLYDLVNKLEEAGYNVSTITANQFPGYITVHYQSAELYNKMLRECDECVDIDGDGEKDPYMFSHVEGENSEDSDDILTEVVFIIGQRTFISIDDGGLYGYADNAQVDIDPSDFVNVIPVGGAAAVTRVAGGKLLSKLGRLGRQARLRELATDKLVSKADKGWLKQELNAIKAGKRKSIRNPPGKELAHKRGKEARKGFGYKHSDLQDKDLHKRQHQVERKHKKKTN
jgi:RHS repeat-associated protein